MAPEASLRCRRAARKQDRCVSIRVGFRRWAQLALVALTACSAGEPDEAGPPQAVSELVVYSSLSHSRTLAVANDYRESTGITVNFLIDSANELVASMAEKRHQPPPDVLLTSGTGVIARALDEDVLRPVSLETPEDLDPQVPLDPDGYWFGLGYSVDGILIGDAIDPDAVLAYADLSSQQFEDRLCLRRGHSERQRTLVAALLSDGSPRDVELAVRGWRRNAAAVPIEDTSSVAQGLMSKRCDAAILGSDTAYALGLIGSDSPLRFVLPRQDSGGAVLHPTIAGVTRHARDPEGARALVQWLLGAAGQRALHAEGNEYPAISSLEPAAELQAARDALSVVATPTDAAFVYEDALRLIERAGYRRPAE